MRLGLAHVIITFGRMNPHEPIFVAPPITEIPDYVWSRRYDKPAFLSGRAVQKPKDTSRKIPHPDAETALKAAKMPIKQGDIPECLILESFRTTILVQQVVVVAVLNGITGRICIAALLDEFTYILGSIGVGLPVAGTINAAANAHPFCFLRSEDLFI